MFDWLPFRKNKSQKFLEVKEAQPGQIVEIRFHDPRKLGMHDPLGLSCTRFNDDELENRLIQGTVEHVDNWEGSPNFGWFISVTSIKGAGQQRKYLFLEHEIDTIRILN